MTSTVTTEFRYMVGRVRPRLSQNPAVFFLSPRGTSGERHEERIPRSFFAPWDPEPTPSPSKEGSDARQTVPLLGGVRGGLAGGRFMGKGGVRGATKKSAQPEKSVAYAS